MKHVWNKEDLKEYFTISSEECNLFNRKPSSRRLIFAALLKFHQYEGRFPDSREEIPRAIISFECNQNCRSTQAAILKGSL